MANGNWKKIFEPLQRGENLRARSKTFITRVTVIYLMMIYGAYIYIFFAPFLPTTALNDLVSYGLLSFMLSLLTIFVFAGDSLQYGKNKYAKFFQEQYPSLHYKEVKNIPDRDTASHLWFQIYNTWEDKGHPNHHLRAAAFERSYTCRLIYYVMIWGIMAAIVSELTLLIMVFIYYYFNNYDVKLHLDSITFKAFAFIGVNLFISLYLLLKHRINGKKGPTGCWRKHQEINNFIKRWIDDNIPRD